MFYFKLKEKISNMLNGKYIDDDGDVFWYKDNLLHREDGPAVEWESGTKKWYKNGELHREDGPAIEYSYGNKEWWLNDIPYSEYEFNKWISKKKLNEKLQSSLSSSPSIKSVKI